MISYKLIWVWFIWKWLNFLRQTRSKDFNLQLIVQKNMKIGLFRQNFIVDTQNEIELKSLQFLEEIGRYKTNIRFHLKVSQQSTFLHYRVQISCDQLSSTSLWPLSFIYNSQQQSAVRNKHHSCCIHIGDAFQYLLLWTFI